MNREDIIRMARKAGAERSSDFYDWSFEDDDQLERFFQAAYAAGAADEREACAKVAERFEPDEKTSYVTYASQVIRARGETK